MGADNLSEKAVKMYSLYAEYEQDPEFDALRKTSRQFVLGAGNLNASIVFVGEAPGANEDKSGKPFVGKAGAMLDTLLKSAHIPRGRVFITNAVHYRPPGNRTPTRDELAASRTYLGRELSIIGPKVVVLLGASAIKAVWYPARPPALGNCHGQVVDRMRPWVYCLMYHPMALIYNGTEETGIDDMRGLRHWCDTHGIRI